MSTTQVGKSTTGATRDRAGTPEAALSSLPESGEGAGGLIGLLQGIQAREGYLSEEALRALSRRTGRSLVDVYGVATFYRSFSLKPRGKHLICACLGTACHVRGAPRIAEELERQLGVKAGQTTPDGQFTLETVNCLGACALGPIVVVDGRCFPNVHTRGVAGILAKVREGMAAARPTAQAAGK